MYTAAPTSNAFPPLQRLEWPANELQKSSSSVDLADAPRCVNAVLCHSHSWKLRISRWYHLKFYRHINIYIYIYISYINVYVYICSFPHYFGGLGQSRQWTSWAHLKQLELVKFVGQLSGFIRVDTFHLRTISPCSELVKPVYYSIFWRQSLEIGPCLQQPAISQLFRDISWP